MGRDRPRQEEVGADRTGRVGHQEGIELGEGRVKHSEALVERPRVPPLDPEELGKECHRLDAVARRLSELTPHDRPASPRIELLTCGGLDNRLLVDGHRLRGREIGGQVVDRPAVEVERLLVRDHFRGCPGTGERRAERLAAHPGPFVVERRVDLGLALKLHPKLSGAGMQASEIGL